MAYSDIKDPSAHFQAKAYTGNGSNGYAITNDGNSNLQPDLWWVKNRDKAYDHNLYDSTRGTSLRLVSNANSAEATATDRIASFDTNGFTLNASVISNENNNPHVAWQWKANGGTTASNSDGSITSTVQANQDAGFSIVSYTGNATNNATVGHGLGAALSVLIIKDLTDGSVWGVWHKDLTNAGYRLTLSTNGAQTTDSGFMGGGNLTLPTSSVFSLGQGGGGNGNNAYIAYCFAEKQGYSKFGSYVGNGNADGPFVYTGFKPAFFLLKKTSGADGWRLFDNKRAGYNDDNYRLAPDAADAEDTATTYLDILSNGVKIRGTAGSFNQSGGTFIYMAFAENPFVTSTGIPTTAR